MIRLVKPLALAALIFMTGFISCSKDKPPDKDHYRAIKVRLNELQNALVSGDQELVAKLLINDLREEEGSTDSLVSFVSAATPGTFSNFADYQIFHTQTRARIDCLLVSLEGDTSEQVSLTWELVSDSLWCLKRWEVGLEPIIVDSPTVN